MSKYNSLINDEFEMDEQILLDTSSLSEDAEEKNSATNADVMCLIQM